MNKLGQVAIITARVVATLALMGAGLLGLPAFISACITGEPGGVAWVESVTLYGGLAGAAIGLVIGLRSAWREVYYRKGQAYERPTP